MTEDWKKEVERIHMHAVGKKIVPFSIEDIRFLSLALCGECGEAANIIKKHWRGDDRFHPKADIKLRKELADIRVYLHLLAMALGIDLDAAVEEKLPEIRAKFPCWPSPAP